VDNYIIVDERLARKVIRDLPNNPMMIHVRGGRPVLPIKVTGLIGLVKHLKTKGALSSEECRAIADNLKNSDFRVTDDLLDELR